MISTSFLLSLKTSVFHPFPCFKTGLSKEIKPINPKGINPDYSLQGLMLKLKLQYSSHLMWRANSLEKTLMLAKIEGRKRSGWQRVRWLGSITDSMDMNLSKLWERVKDREAQRAAVPGVTKSQTRRSDWTTTDHSQLERTLNGQSWNKLSNKINNPQSKIIWRRSYSYR